MKKNNYLDFFEAQKSRIHSKFHEGWSTKRNITSLLMLFFLFTFSGVSLAQGPVVNYPFDGNLLDVSGNNYHGTSATATLTTDRFGAFNKAYRFSSSGSGSVINLPLQNALKPGLPFSFSCWVRFDDPGLDDEESAVFNTEFVNDKYTGFWFGLNNAGRVFVSYGDGGSPSPAARRTVTSNVNISVGVWYNITAIISGPTNMQLFVTPYDGSPDQCPDVSTTSTLSGSGGAMVYQGGSHIGMFGRYDATTLSPAIHKFDGRVDDFKMWNRALTLNELQEPCEEPEPCYAVLKSLNANPGKKCGTFNMTASVNAPNVSPFNASHSWLIHNSSGVLVYSSGSIPGFPNVFTPHVNFPALTVNGSYIITFYFSGTDNNGQYCKIKKQIKVKVDCNKPPADCTVWPKSYGVNDPANENNDVEKGDGILVDQDENVYVHGRVRPSTVFDNGSTIPGGTFLAKYDSCGTLIWVNDVTALGEKIRKIEMDGNGDIVLLAWTGEGTAFSTDIYYLSKIKQDGNVLWSNPIQHKYLPWPSFDVDDNTNQIYMALNLNQSIIFQDQSGSNVININTSTSPQVAGVIVRVNPSGFVTYTENVNKTKGYFRFQDVAVAENTSRVYFTGAMGDISSLPHPQVTFTASGNTVSSFLSKDVLLASYATNSFAPSHVWSQATGDTGYETAMQLGYSDASNYLFLRNLNSLTVYSSLGATISSTTTLSGLSGRMRFNEQDNYIMLNGTTSCNELRMAKYSLTSLTWQYSLSSCGSAKAYVYDANFSPLNDRIYFTGGYWYGDMNIFGTTLPLAGGRDVFISRIEDGGSAPIEKSALSSGNAAVDFKTESSELLLFPNPVVNELNIALPNDESEDVTISVMDASGKVIQVVNKSGNSFRLNTADLTSGMYHIKVTSSTRTWDRKFVK